MTNSRFANDIILLSTNMEESEKMVNKSGGRRKPCSELKMGRGRLLD